MIQHVQVALVELMEMEPSAGHQMVAQTDVMETMHLIQHQHQIQHLLQHLRHQVEELVM